MKQSFLHMWGCAVVLAAAFAATVPQAMAQPFGIAMGTPMSALEIIGETPGTLDMNNYLLSSVANPHSAFKDYTVTVKPGTGVCQISARSERYQNDQTGRKVRAAFDTVLDQLVSKYGDPRFNTLDNSESEPIYDVGWARSVHVLDVNPMAMWFSGNDTSLSNDISNIRMMISASDPSTTQFWVSYNYDNAGDCFDVFLRENATDIDAFSQHFGIEMGTAIADLDGAQPANDDSSESLYDLATAPNPHSLFESYTVMATPNSGVCLITAESAPIKGRTPIAMGAAFDNIKFQIDSKFGPGQLTLTLKEGSSWQSHDDWVMAVHQEDRTQVALWGVGLNENLPEDVTMMTLNVEAPNADTSKVTLTYMLSNFTACAEELLPPDSTESENPATTDPATKKSDADAL